MAIPKIIYQTWKNKTTIPSQLLTYSIIWKRMHREYKYNLLDDNDLRNSVLKIVPQFISHYDSFSHNIERVDFSRYAILYETGGIYADLDTYPLKSFDKLVNQDNIILGCEPKLHSKNIYGKDCVICNAIMLSPAKHDFWMDLMKYIIEEYKYNSDPVITTGPMSITLFYEKYKNDYSNVKILDACYFYPMINKGTISKECNIDDSYAVHIWNNSWTNDVFGNPIMFVKRHLPFIIFGLLIILFIIFSIINKRST